LVRLGAWEQVSSMAMLMAVPIATWEFALGVYMTVKGFKRPATAEDSVEVAPPAPSLSTAAA
jgi:hypothetical protein